MRVTVFAGSSMGSRPEYAAAAAELGTGLAQAGVGLVYGGSDVGLMGVMARAAMAASSQVIGVIPQVLGEAVVAAPFMAKLEVVGSLPRRYATLAQPVDPFPRLARG